ncbi:hypothetical protein GCM10010441_63060 [Kitasatospora paracochleata]
MAAPAPPLRPSAARHHHFADEDARQAHLTGRIPAALSQVGPELLAADPDLRLVDVLALKHTG